MTSLLARFLQLNLGLALMGLGIAVMVRADIGLGPLEVLGQGIARQTPLSIGQALQACGLAVVVACYVVLKYKPGLGTILNMLLVGAWADVFLLGTWLPAADGVGWAMAQTMVGTVAMAAATGMYITARMGAGPNDSLMIGLARTYGIGVRWVRAGIEGVMLIAGFALGGSVGMGTVLFALTIGPLVQMFLRLFGSAESASAARPATERST